jgi:hypothetical protein
MYRKSLKTSDLDIPKEQARKAGTKIISDVCAGKKLIISPHELLKFHIIF